MLQTREFVNTKQPIYKIGRTQQPLLTRFNQYSKGSVLIIHINVNDSIILEKEIISVFTKQFTCKKDLGREYFEGDITKMKKSLCEICCREDETQNDPKQKVIIPPNEPPVSNNRKLSMNDRNRTDEERAYCTERAYVNNTIDHNIKSTRFVTLNDKQVACVDCGKCLSNRYKKHHACRGAPLNMCKFCKRQFNHASNLTVHRKRCKANPVNITNVITNTELLERIREDNEDFENKIQLLQIQAMIQELVIKKQNSNSK
jgi:hypothetical protein